MSFHGLGGQIPPGAACASLAARFLSIIEGITDDDIPRAVRIAVAAAWVPDIPVAVGVMRMLMRTAVATVVRIVPVSAMAIIVVMSVQALMPMPLAMPLCVPVTVLLVMPCLLSVVVTFACMGRECHTERARANQYCAEQGCH
jgi:Na+/glutamate symporter